jgi:hypothetical protein
MLSFILLSVVMLSVITLGAMAHIQDFFSDRYAIALHLKRDS